MSEKTQVIIWVDSGDRVMKSQYRAGSWILVSGAGFKECTISGNLMASRIKNTGR
ncbi:hypothetical protein D1872_297780 [compost metagenome]